MVGVQVDKWTAPEPAPWLSRFSVYGSHAVHYAWQGCTLRHLDTQLLPAPCSLYARPPPSLFLPVISKCLTNRQGLGYLVSMPNYDRLINSLQKADTDPKTFKMLLARASKDLKLVDRILAERLHVSRPTIARWRNGICAPFEPMREVVYRALIQLAKERT